MINYTLRFLAIDLFALSVLILSSCGYRNAAGKLLKERTLLYCLRDDNAVYRPLYNIMEFRGDSIYQAVSRTDSLQEWYFLKRNSSNPSNFYVPFQMPYALKRNGNRIELLYNDITKNGGIYKKDQYSFDSKDSIKCINLNYLCKQESGYSNYQGDTVIYYKNQKLRCLVFREYYPGKSYDQDKRDMTITRYLEKSTLLPVKIHTEFYESKGFKLPAIPENKSYSILFASIHRDSLRSNLEVRIQYCQ